MTYIQQTLRYNRTLKMCFIYSDDNTIFINDAAVAAEMVVYLHCYYVVFQNQF